MKSVLESVALAAFALAAYALEPSGLAPLFPREADLYVSKTGLSRLDLPEEIIAACRPDLSDLRIFDGEDRELPFVIDGGAPAGVHQTQEQVVTARILNVDRKEIRRESGPALHRESYQIAVPAEFRHGGSWEIEIKADAPRFVRTARISAIDASGAATELVATQSVFRLSEEREKIRLPLPLVSAAMLEIVIEGEEGSFIDPRFFFASAREVERPQPIRVVLRESGRESRGRGTVLLLARPPGVVPDVVRIESATEWLDRAVEVWDERSGFPDRSLGRGRLQRVRADREKEQLDVRVEPALGQRLRVEIADGDSPPLASISVIAVVRRPSLIFAVALAGEDGSAGKLRFGGGRAYRPMYDVGPLRRRESAGGNAVDDAAVVLDDGAQLGAARLGPTRPNPSYDRTPLLSFALRAGAAVDARLYTHRRHLQAQPSPEGVSRLRLTIDDLALARADLGDLRIIDRDGKQWPYLIDSNTPPQRIALEIAPGTRSDHMSRYVIRAGQQLAVGQLILETDVPFLDRSYRLSATRRAGGPLLVASGTLTKQPDRPQPITLHFAPIAPESFELTIDDGDNATIDWSSVATEMAIPDLLLVAPAGEYSLLVGYAEATAPHYELVRVRPLVFAIDTGVVESAELQDNPAFSQAARLSRDGRARNSLQQLLIWSTLVVAVLVLGIITLRVVRSSAAESPADGGNDTTRKSP